MKKLSEISIHKKILKAIEEGNVEELTFLLIGLDFENVLNYVTDENDKSLHMLIQESTIPERINKQCKIHFAKEVTPLQKMFLINEGQTHPPFRELSLLLKLGADVNQHIDQQGNTFLHEYVRRHVVHPIIVTRFYLGGGDFFKKNNLGEAPIDQMAVHEVRFLNRLIQTQDRRYHAATLIQRQWRLNQQKKQIPPTMPPFEHPLLLKPVQEPVFNPLQIEQTEAWIEQHSEQDREVARKVIDSIQHISYHHFLFGLKNTIRKFNEFLLSLPEFDRNYVLVIDGRTDKSNLWVTKLAEKYLAIAPKEIVKMTDLVHFVPGADLQHLVIIDDASYSGNFFFHFLMDYNNKIMVQNNQLMNLKFHLVIPFTTDESRLIFQKHGALVHTQETLPIFSVKGTCFRGKTATFFDHKIPSSISTIECIESGKLITGEESEVRFVTPFLSPYKQ
ncbi:phosphoribosyltransferase-like protein [Legionella sp. WA2022007384]